MLTKSLDRDRKSYVQSVGKAFRLMQAFGADEHGYVLAELARRAGLDNGTTFRLLNTLVQLGYVEKIEGTRSFVLSLKCLELGFNAISRADLRALARPQLRKILGKSADAASIGVLDRNEVVYIERIQSGLTRLVVDVRIGDRVPVHSTAMGLAILSTLPEKRQREILGKSPLSKMTPNTITDIEKVIKRLQSVRKDGYAVSDQENVTGLRVLAAPIVDEDGFAAAGVSAAASASGRTCQQFEKEMRSSVIDAANNLSRALQASGGTAPHGPDN